MNAAEPETLPPRWRDRVFAVGLEPLALFRIALGVLLLADSFVWARDLEMHLSDTGILPRDLWAIGFAQRPSFHTLSGSATFEAALLALGLLPALAFMLGWHTRPAQLLTWIFWMSLQHRNPLVLNGGDEVLRLLLFWSLFLPLGARWSLDARAGRVAARWRDADVVRNVASAALLLQVALIYPVAALLKLRHEVWQEFRFVGEAMQVDGIATDFGRWLLGFPALLPVLSFGALQLELFGALLALSPWGTRRLRFVTAAAFMSFHGLGIGTTFSIGLFSWVMVAAWIPFLPAVRKRPNEPSERIEVRESRVQSTLLATLLAGVLLLNVASLGWIPQRGAQPVGQVLAWVRLDQRWRLWVEVVSNRHYLFAGETLSGRRVDLHRDSGLADDGARLDWSNPRRAAWNTRWWKYLLHLSRPGGSELRPDFARALAGRFNRAHPEDPLVRIELWISFPPENGQPRRSRLLWAPDGAPRLGPGPRFDPARPALSLPGSGTEDP